MNGIISYLQKKNVVWKAKLLLPYLSGRESILDFGCGDLSLAKELKNKKPGLTITGVDVVNPKEKSRSITFISYDGKQLPFRKNSFDTVISFYVYHHCESAEIAFSQCLSVAKKRVIFIEPIARNYLDELCMRLMDWVYNVWKPEKIPLSYQFLSLVLWIGVIKKNNGLLKSIKEIKSFFSLLPIGKAYIFEVYKSEKA